MSGVAQPYDRLPTYGALRHHVDHKETLDEVGVCVECPDSHNGSKVALNLCRDHIFHVLSTHKSSSRIRDAH